MDKMFPEFEPHPLLRNGHAMTITAALVPRRFDLAPAEERRFRMDEDTFLLGHCHWQPGRKRDVPVLVVVHGLEGSSDSNYAEASLREHFTVASMWSA